jgi:predicted phosphoribosyltransferase
MVLLPFKDRNSAGDQLARVLEPYRGRTGLLVVGLPRGGVPVAARIAEQLDVALDVIVVRKLGTPGHEELAMGAIASGGIRVLNDEIVRYMDIDEDTIEMITARESVELERRERIYRRKHKKINMEDRSVILVDDGLATGTTMMAAVQSARHEGASTLIVAVPVAPQDSINALYYAADEVVCLKTPDPFSGVGIWYVDFSQTSDEEVMALLKRARYRMKEVRKQ